MKSSPFVNPTVVDVAYLPDGLARAAFVVAENLSFAESRLEQTALFDDVAGYRSGFFYERELPPLRVLLKRAEVPADLLVIDGYVDLDPDGRWGLGAHLHDEFGVPVIGVAKSRFRTASHAIPVVRGAATRPLWVTARGVSGEFAASLVSGMAGRYRIPSLLRRVDRLARGVDRAGVYTGPIGRGGSAS